MHYTKKVPHRERAAGAAFVVGLFTGYAKDKERKDVARCRATKTGARKATRQRSSNLVRDYPATGSELRALLSITAALLPGRLDFVHRFKAPSSQSSRFIGTKLQFVKLDNASSSSAGILSRSAVGTKWKLVHQ